VNTVTIRGLSRTECAVLMTYSILGGLCDKGFIDGGLFKISDQGASTCNELRAAGFEFNEGEMEEIVSWLVGGGEQRVALGDAA
jgi:hypothetical protein